MKFSEHRRGRRSWFIHIVVGIFIAVIPFVTKRAVEQSRSQQIWLKGQRFTVELADETSEQTRGLSGRKSLCKKCGMLFVYPDAAVRNFWMKDMEFPLDFVWLEGGRVVDLTHSVPPPRVGEVPAVVNSDEATDAVLELNAGTVARLGLVRGDQVKQKR